ncbi:hypothetical protein SEPL_310 [Salmonella phage SE_PL]|nr:hypothetical protein CPT_Munch_115 [Salmonella phage Munch]EAZ2022908.1 hypothetical protein [Salmonella enterica]ECV9084042.1 hypothetical protein [Salmonella enterica subsp. enterica serovar Infantis]QCW18794.1 hypothetical protein 7t3_0273 [Salmonella phage 7t3]QIG62923.1 hypothetical protein SEPL_310 [Salmonella phage SE_PL]
MLVIGSQAFRKFKPNIVPKDLDYMCTNDELDEQIKYFSTYKNFELVTRTETYCHLKFNNMNYEFYIAKDNNSTEQLLRYCNAIGTDVYAPLDVLYAIKLSHRYLRNSPHFIKTRTDIRDMERMGANVFDPDLKRILELREKETYNYSHPVLDQPKETFFQDEVGYIYDHDTIHEAIAIMDKPAYKNYMKDGAEVMVDKKKFFECNEHIQLLGVYEETCVLALERCLVPYPDVRPKDAFITALIKVCTSITSGWFREFAYNNFYKVIQMYREFGEDDFVQRFNANQHMIKPFKEEVK